VFRISTKTYDDKRERERGKQREGSGRLHRFRFEKKLLLPPVWSVSLTREGGVRVKGRRVSSGERGVTEVKESRTRLSAVSCRKRFLIWEGKRGKGSVESENTGVLGIINQTVSIRGQTKRVRT